MLATPNPDDFATGRESEADRALLVRFSIREREDKEASKTEGRPIFKETEYIEIRVPGKRDAQACRPATHADKLRFPRHYDMFQRRVETPAEGTPLSEWPQITRSMVEQLSFLNIKTVEQLTMASDTDMSNIHGGVSLKQRATEFLKYADKTKLIAEKEAQTAQLAEQQGTIDEQAKQIAELQATVSNLVTATSGAKQAAPAEIDATAEAPPTTKPRRRRKTAEETADEV